MTIFDIVVIFVLFIFFLFSLFKGIVREVFSLFGYIAGYVLAINYNDTLATTLQGMVTQDVMARIAGFAIIFVIVKIVVTLVIFFSVKFILGLLGYLISRFMDGSKVLSLPDRILGGVLGVFKGLVVIAIIMFPLSLFEDSYNKITSRSVLSPYFEKMVNFVSQPKYNNKLINDIPKLLVDDIRERVNQIDELETFSDEFKKRKDNLLNTVESLIDLEKSQEKSQENLTDEDKNKLNELLNTFSNQ